MEFISASGIHINENLKQLWRRIVFSICISNTDDHLQNHGFTLTPNGWTFSPAYDLNPSIDKDGLALNIDEHNKAMDVGEYFRLSISDMNAIIGEVKHSVQNWKRRAQDVGISRAKQELMKSAFRV